MRRLILIIILCGFLYTAKAQGQLWQVGTAITMPKGWFDKGVFQPLRFGLTSKTELSAYPVLMAFMPNLAVKHRWHITDKKWFLSTKHGVYYPSMLLKRTVGGGPKYLLPSTTKVPFLLPTYHEFLASKYLKPKTSCDYADYLLTLKVGFAFTIGKATDSDMSSIDYPFVFHPTQTYYQRFFWYVGADLEARLTDFLNYSIDLDVQSVQFLKHWAFSHKGLLVWPINNRWTLAGGYRLHYGAYPFGTQFKAMPLVDISYKFRFLKKKRFEKGLFKTNRLKYDNFQEKDHKIKQDEYEEFYEDDKQEIKRKPAIPASKATTPPATN